VAWDRIVVGAGVSGLADAWWARERGERVLVLEESPRAGGVVRTDVGTTPEGSWRLERGASTLPSSATAVARLAAAQDPPVALRPAAPAARRQLLWTRAGLRALPRTPRALVESPLFGLGATLRLLAEAARGPRRPGRSETLHGFVRRRFGVVPAERLLRPFTSGVYAAAPERLGAADAFPTLAVMEQRRGSVLRGMLAARTNTRREVVVPEDGMETLVRRMAASLDARLASPVTGVRAGGVVECADGSRHEGGSVVLAVPADRQASLLRPLLSDVADALDLVPYVPLAVVALGVRRGVPEVPDAFGFLRLPGRHGRILGATFLSRIDPSAAPEGHDLLNVYLGGSEDPGVLDLPDERLCDVVLRDVGRALGGRVEPVLLDVHRWPRAIPLLTPGHRGRLARLAALAEPLGVRLLGSHVTGIGVHRCAAAGAPAVGTSPA
jgi:oxygen-dependent protoporphyrinogen oxidase